MRQICVYTVRRQGILRCMCNSGKSRGLKRPRNAFSRLARRCGEGEAGRGGRPGEANFSGAWHCFPDTFLSPRAREPRRGGSTRLYEQAAGRPLERVSPLRGTGGSRLPEAAECPQAVYGCALCSTRVYSRTVVNTSGAGKQRRSDPERARLLRDEARRLRHRYR